ncbi:glutamine amidotransferase subunit PdxT [Leptotrichia sp. oral taxon 498]|uniref:pyridoxal 5'-phosphate synthase glutaminase subunit PdxT n=1 Tax=Leptotrichia sp. oral taxon 498 TaxID=712368 RepID=UPI000B8CE50F|nr:pyridoxal 5'-phosphate synthase glutaminase subunit PdxT [Leptotrichia sp. oral taxon 498]ASQ48081.1 glutamine amidotransferase subunit PdxT [Leptotrichia sp. oral taxon 498]
MKIGVLALQGAFAEHRKMLKKLGIESFEIRKKSDLSNAVNNNDIDGLIIPGGESTVIGKLLYDLDLFDDIKKLILEGLPVFGTCAGLILLAREIENDSRTYLGAMDIKVRRNAYGRQLGSFFTESEFKGIGVIPMTFIRAPYISSVGKNVEVLSEVDGNVVAARENNILVTSYHPELNDNLKVHKFFVEMCKLNK